MLITADFNGLMSQAPETAALYLRRARQEIDSVFGKGFAADNPGLVAAFMQTAMLDFCTATKAKVFESAVGQLAEAFSQNGTGSLADAIAQIAEAIEQQ